MPVRVQTLRALSRFSGTIVETRQLQAAAKDMGYGSQHTRVAVKQIKFFPFVHQIC